MRQVNWEVATLDDVLDQDVPYAVMVDEARDGIACLAEQDHPRRGEVDSDEPGRGWYYFASEAGDLATCRMIDLIRDNGEDPQDIYDAAFDQLKAEG